MIGHAWLIYDESGRGWIRITESDWSRQPSALLSLCHARQPRHLESKEF